MSEHSAKRRKTTNFGSASVVTIYSLPPELLEIVVGFLDVGTLCTARLVCVQFRGAASRFLHLVQLSVETLRSRPDTTLNNFPNLSRVGVFDVKEDDLLMLGQSPVAASVTHLRTVEHLRSVPPSGGTAAPSPWLPFPNLTSLTVGCRKICIFNCIISLPQTLRELRLEASLTCQTADIVTGLTKLTCLQISLYDIMAEPFKAITALTALQRLEIRHNRLTLIPFLAELTLLTHLQFQLTFMPPSPSDLALVASLTRLHGLVHLGAGHSGADWDAQSLYLASMATITELRSLDLELCHQRRGSPLQSVCMTPFSQLTLLRLKGFEVGVPFLYRFNLERLQSLTLSWKVDLDLCGAAALRRATNLTHLELGGEGTSMGLEKLGCSLRRMSQLRALSLWIRSDPTLSLKTIGLLTELTRLQLRGGGVTTNADVEMCLGLTKLRVLCIDDTFALAPADRITPETFFAVAKLSQLRKFTVKGEVEHLRGDRTERVRACINADRQDRGWPPLELTV